jgi:PPM family protein phosphatase
VWGAATDTGRHRERNEDSFLAEGRVFAVADGMGGHAAGDVASGMIIDALRPLAHSDVLSTRELTEVIQAANDDIVVRGFQRAPTIGMGTTVTGVALVSGADTALWAVFNVGDSRVYRFRDGRLTQVTVDHSEVQELIDAGRITPEQARTDLRRHIVTRALGTIPAPPVDLWILPPEPGEQFLICSDGLTEELTDPQIEKVLADATTPAEAAANLVDEALRAGGHDNVTVVVVAAS